MQVLLFQRILNRFFVMGAKMITPAVRQQVFLVGNCETLLAIEEPPIATKHQI